jgi:hypothetical protein
MNISKQMIQYREVDAGHGPDRHPDEDDRPEE